MTALPHPQPILAERPKRAPLVDAQGRRITYLRLSVTDRCNFRCAYCSPASWGGTKELLTAQEFLRIADVFAQVGIRRVRLTGGEPLLRPDLLELSAGLRLLPGIEQVAITTNASRLSQLARPLAKAGVTQLNLSLDTLDEATFRTISPKGELSDVLAGIDAAVQAGFPVLKLNVVVMRGVNDHEAKRLVDFAHARKMVPRFIELMPFGKGTPVPTAELCERLRAEGLELTELPPPTDGLPLGPARYLRAPGGEVGFISSLTQNFCGGCNRVRISAKGELRSCLGGRSQAPLAELLRQGATDDSLVEAIRAALGQKPEGHQFNAPDARAHLLSMMGIGG